MGAVFPGGPAAPTPRPEKMMAKIFETLKCDLTDEELLETGRQLARAQSNLTHAEANKKQIDARLKGEIDGYRLQAAELSERVNTGYELRAVECKEVPDRLNLNVQIIRMDTGELVRQRAMTEREREQLLPFGHPPENGDSPEQNA